MTQAVHAYPLQCVDWLILNETEGGDLSGDSEPEAILDKLLEHWPHLRIVLTMGGEGAIYAHSAERLRVPACKVQPVDTTAAGDTFVGYLLASLVDGHSVESAMRRASRAAALSVTRPGAADSIPRSGETDAFSGD